MADNKTILHGHIANKKYKMTAQEKSMENTLKIYSFHEFSDKVEHADNEGEFGYDWYFIKQTPNLNGRGKYEKYFAGMRVRIDKANWYVGQGTVALYYVQSYEMETEIKMTDENKDYIKYIDTIGVEPKLINDIEEFYGNIEFKIDEFVGASIEVERKDNPVNNSYLIKQGINYKESIKFNVEGCSCSGYDGESDNMSKVRWEYIFNPPSGKYQKIDGPTELAISEFEPINMLVWKIPTKYRNLFKQMKTSLKVTNESIITRYSGSQSAKRIPSPPDIKEEIIDLPFPSIIATDFDCIKFDNKGGIKEVFIMSEYKKIDFDIVDSNNKPCNWIKVEHKNPNTKESKLIISVSEMKGLNNRSCKIKITGNNDGSKLEYQTNEKDLQSINIDIYQNI